ncbi:lysozyme inhibitor LprI family protein [Herbaspirillum robiniae]|uniref:Lysozyme inhibitor LprI N-terminal domain-containing protein n=1 Tax=Herbaspirillum robiniae TaxID=2014887 RepID=A0A246WU77_9BURK|nr:hypothetical protein [Herbaspirillum robiniae]OWY30619.1 hypothetical protein CEJ42_00595 [Herbaspirillum robiniae]
MKTSFLRAALAAQCLIASAPLFAASFDCARAGSANEKTICADPELSALDDRLGKAYRQARLRAADRRAFSADSDKQWRWREQNCHDRACLLDWYRRREGELQALAQGSIDQAASLPARATRASLPAAAVMPSAAPTPAPAPALAAVIPALATPANGAVPLRLNLSASQVAGIAPAGAAPWPHYVRVDQGEYFYEDPQGGARGKLVAARYYGIENGQYIIEVNRGSDVLRYTCSADCAYIGQLALPGDVEKDMVIVRNDRNSLPSIIVNDAVNGLLAQSRVR